MGSNSQVMLAGAFKTMGDTWLATLSDWTGKFLMVALVSICCVQVVRKMSIKAGIGAVIGLVICWALFTGRLQLSSMFNTEFTGGTTGAAAPQDVVELPQVFKGRL